jgi:hypothetical protein
MAHKKFFEEEIIKQLKVLGKKLGRLPEVPDITVAKKSGQNIPCVDNIIWQFGKFKKAIYIAFVMTDQERQGKVVSRDSLEKSISNFKKANKRFPDYTDISQAQANGEFPTFVELMEMLQVRMRD